MKVTHFHLGTTEVTDVGVAALANSPLMAGVQLFGLGFTPVGNEGMKALAQSQFMKCLRHINLGNTRVDDAGLEALASSPFILQLHHLDLWNTLVSDKGVTALARSSSMAQIEHLNLGSTRVGDNGVSILAQSSFFSRLKYLDLRDTSVSDGGMKALAESPFMRNLEHLDLFNSNVPLPAQLKQSHDAKEILRYFREAHLGKPLYEVKVPILGMGGQGKSLLSRRLGPQDTAETSFVEDHPATHAFESRKIVLRVVRDGQHESFSVRLFDFGGQPDMHGAHRFFLADQRNVYLIIVNARHDRSQNRLDYWLRMVKYHGAGAPAVIVVSHCDKRPNARHLKEGISACERVLETLDAKKLEIEHGLPVQVVDGYSNVDGTNLEQVKESLRRSIAGLDAVHRVPFAPGFFQVRDWLDGNPSKNLASHSEFRTCLTVQNNFRQICSAVGQTDIGQQDLWLVLLRDLGYSHYVGDKPEVSRNKEHGLADLMFHPEWVKNPVYDIVRYSEAQSRNGIVSAPDLDKLIINRNIMDVNDRRRLVALMCACELIFKVRGGGADYEYYLIPDQIGRRPVNAGLQWTATPKKKLRWEFPFLPDHLLAQLLGRWYDDQPVGFTYYRDELVLRSADRSCRVRLRADFNAHCVDLEFDAELDKQWEKMHTSLENEIGSILDPERIRRRRNEKLWYEVPSESSQLTHVTEMSATSSSTRGAVDVSSPKPDVVLVTVNRHETRAVLDAFEAAIGTKAVAIPLDDRVYHNLGTLNGTTVYHALSEMGSGGAGGMQQTVDKAIRALDPGSVIAVGVAFGVDESDQAIGDILVSRQLRLYELQKIGKESRIILRGARPEASTRLINHFVGFAQSKWDGVPVRPGVILTGEKLIDNVDYREQLRVFECEAVGGEMEGAGLYVSVHDHKRDWIVVKAICDWADGDKGTNKNERQKLAAKNAADFLVQALKYAPLKRR